MNLVKTLLLVLFVMSNTFKIDINSVVDKVKNMAYQEVFGTNNYYNYIEKAKEKYNNNEIVARLIMDSIDLDLFIVQHDDNNFYLSHDEYGNESDTGAIFLDYRNNIDVDRKVLLFGHNSKNVNTNFKKLEKFLNSSFFNNSDNRKLTIETSNKRINYEISSIFLTNKDSEHMKLSFSKNEWTNHIDWLNNSSIYDGEKLGYNDSILIMQTCYYEKDNSYLLVVAKKTSESFY